MYQGYELIVSDNCSSDDAEEVVSSFAAPRIRYGRTDQNLGLLPNFNRCIDLATGDYVLLLGDDDRWRRHYLERAIDVLDGLIYMGPKIVRFYGSRIN